MASLSPTSHQQFRKQRIHSIWSTCRESMCRVSTCRESMCRLSTCRVSMQSIHAQSVHAQCPCTECPCTECPCTGCPRTGCPRTGCPHAECPCAVWELSCGMRGKAYSSLSRVPARAWTPPVWHYLDPGGHSPARAPAGLTVTISSVLLFCLGFGFSKSLDV